MSTPDPQPARAALVRLVRDEGRRVLATLVRVTGDLQLAEDAVQDATERALATWPRDGVPSEPRAWLTLTARRRAIDLARREAARGGKEADAVALLDPPAEEPDEPAVRDDLLRLVFTCCHPALDVPSQVALALRTLCGLSAAEVGRALLVSESTMTKRLTRAKQKIARARIPYRVPDDHELPERLRGVLATVYLLFNEGYSASHGDAPVRPALVGEAVRLTRLLAELMPGEASVLGLLALELLQDSRRAARHQADGRPVLLPDQDRSRWDRALITEGVVLVGEGLRRSPDVPDPYVVQAAIAACHALAPSWPETDWAAVLSWYEVLLTVQDTPVVRLNRAVAVAELHGPGAGLAELDAVSGLDDYPAAHAARAELLARLGRDEEAAAAYAAALRLPQNAAHRAHLRDRLAALTERRPDRADRRRAR
ncbi:RNA polymerase sigma factor [Pseudonocardia lacus]|uniref:RNA polymerase sigma factor n=1 Tax=Pseudonocardia lacus TaxID=2835865 RepID=UPI001BDD8941|nr:sigma-70 family RNA polymerase sigma factor [Pseudonocardia lacus]